jgi:glycoside/pentoside/hexuronide:cation symporter, GPH family
VFDGLHAPARRAVRLETGAVLLSVSRCGRFVLMIALFVVVLWPSQTSRYGKIPAFVVSLIVCAVSGVLTFFSLFIESPYPFCITLGILGFGFAGTGMAVNIMLSDTIDYDELHTGKRRESTYHVRAGLLCFVWQPARQ